MQVFVGFFKRQAVETLRVLDIGCGQRRDALFIAGTGHRVVGLASEVRRLHQFSLQRFTLIIDLGEESRQFGLNTANKINYKMFYMCISQQ
jgi:hypothetical protein